MLSKQLKINYLLPLKRKNTKMDIADAQIKSGIGSCASDILSGSAYCEVLLSGGAIFL